MTGKLELLLPPHEKPTVAMAGNGKSSFLIGDPSSNVLFFDCYVLSVGANHIYIHIYIYIIIAVSVFNKNAHIYIHVQADLIAIHKFVKAKIPQKKS